MEDLESEIAEWRAFVDRRAAVERRDGDELEAHLRDQIADLAAAGLTADEAFLVAVKRMGKLDDLSREFAREHSGRLWRQMVLSPDREQAHAGGGWVDGLPLALTAAVAAATAVLVARLAAGWPGEESSWLPRNLGLLVVPWVVAYFARRRQMPWRWSLTAAGPILITAVLINVYPFDEGSSTEPLVAAHLPVLLWFLVAWPYAGGDLRSHERRMDFVRFTGEWTIYYVLIGLGGGVLLALTGLVLEPAGVDAERMVEWVLPSAAAGGVIVAAWLVEAKQSVIENMAPVLTMLFTPLFALMLAVAAVVYAATGIGRGFDRELLGVFDALLVVVLALVLYGMSARDPHTPVGWMDRIQLVAVGSALVLDVMVLVAMLDRIGELGFTPNRAVALGLNLVLLANLAGTAWLSARFVTGRGTLFQVERWQTAYLPVFAVWVAAAVVLIPPLFAFA